MAEPAHIGAEDEVRYLPAVSGETVAHPIEPEPREMIEWRPGALAAPAVAAAGGFLAGVVAFVLVRVLRRRAEGAPARRARNGMRRRRGEPEISASRSFLIDVHLLKR